VDHSKRKILRVSVSGLSLGHDEAPNVQGTVDLALSDYTGESVGPEIRVYVAVPFEAKNSIQDAEVALLDAARGVLSRLLEHPLSEWQSVLKNSQQKQF
jgi:hypothetical protein